MLASCRFLIGKTDEISKTLHLMHVGISLIKSYEIKWVILGQELTGNNLRK
jgi:hypothetical protein